MSASRKEWGRARSAPRGSAHDEAAESAQRTSRREGATMKTLLAIVLVSGAAACVELESEIETQELTTESGACKVVYTTSDWDSGFTATVRVTNKGAAKNGWSLRWQYGAGQRVGSIWNATAVQTGGTVTVSAVSWNRALATGATVELGFNGTKSSANPAPAEFFLDGASCGSGAGPSHRRQRRAARSTMESRTAHRPK